jgi:alkylation response protein AidB-like acyl-CoA dehydrogenase
MATNDVSRGIHELLPSIRKRREEIEKARRMPRDLVEQLSRTGVFAQGVPRAVGGAEASPLDLMRSTESVATADGSAGWCTMIGSSGNLTAGYMPEAGAKEVFADPTAPTAGIAAPSGAATRVDGGVRVSGRWSFASGITHCDWVFAGCLVMENGKPRMTPHGPEILHVWLPVANVAVHDTWYVSGLCGTGSNDFSATDVFIPEQRTFRLIDPTDHRKEPLYQMPPVGMFVFQVVCVSLGIARAALDELTEIAQTKMPTLYMQVLADKPVVQVDLARAEAELGAARAYLFEAVEEIWDAVRSGRTPTPRQIAQGRIAATHSAETAARVTRTASRLAGGSAIYNASPMQRHARDAEAVTHHFTVAPYSWEEAGRVLLGRQPTTPVF